MEKIKYYPVLLSLFISTITIAQENALSVRNYIELLKKNDPNFELIINEKLKKDYLVDQGLPSREFLLSATTEYGFALDDSENTNQVGVNLTKSLIESGTDISLSRSQNKLSDRKETLTKVEIEQKIFNDGLGSNTRLKKKALEKEVSILELQIQESYEDYIKEKLEVYFDLGRLYSELESSKEIYAEAKKLYSQVQAKAKKSIATTTDLKRAKLQMLVREDELLENENLYKKSLLTISSYIGKKLQKEIPEFSFDFHKKIKKTPFSEDDLRGLRSFKIKDDLLQNSKAYLEIEKSSSGASASIIAGASMDDSKRFNTTVKNEELLIGLRVDIPFGDTVQEANEKEKNYNYIKARLEKKNYITERLATIKEIELELKSKQKRLQLAKEKAQLAQSIVNEDNKRYENGRLDLEELISTRNNRVSYQKAYLNEQMAYNKLVVEFLSATDSLID